MKYKNYYKILGLDSSRASEEDIKVAYRRLAKQYHPDINQGNEIASERFKDINEAYQVLGNEESKRKYDRVHFAYKLKDSFKLKDGLNKSGFDNFVNMFVGNAVQNNKNVTNSNNIPTRGDNLESTIEVTLEEAFDGIEKKLAFKQLDGKMKNVVVKIPKGVNNNSKIRLAGQGKPGKNGGKSGDLFITIKIIENKKFKLDDANLIAELPLTPWEAALGCKLNVESLDSKINITVPPGVQSGEKLRIAKNGYFDINGDRGDLLLNLKIVVPKELTEEEQKLFDKMKQISHFSPRDY